MVTTGKMSYKTYDTLCGVILFATIALVIWAIVAPSGFYASLFGGRWIAVLSTPVIGFALIVLAGCFLAKIEKTTDVTITGKFAAVEKNGRNYITFLSENREEQRVFVPKKDVFESINIGDYGKLSVEKYVDKDWVFKGFSQELVSKSTEEIFSCKRCGGNNIMTGKTLRQCQYCNSPLE